MAGMGIGIKKIRLSMNQKRNRNGIRDILLESESEILKMLESDLEAESRHARNRASLM